MRKNSLKFSVSQCHVFSDLQINDHYKLVTLSAAEYTNEIATLWSQDRCFDDTSDNLTTGKPMMNCRIRTEFA